MPAQLSCRLGVSFFLALGLRRHDRPRYNQELQWFRDVLKPDYARIFWYLAGGPWGIVGTGHISDSERRALLAAVLEEFLAANIRPQVTVFGAWVPDPDRRRQIVEQFADVFRPFGSRCFLVDGVNEPGAIFFHSNEQSRYAETREVARMLANTGLGVPHNRAGLPRHREC